MRIGSDDRRRRQLDQPGQHASRGGPPWPSTSLTPAFGLRPARPFGWSHTYELAHRTARDRWRGGRVAVRQDIPDGSPATGQSLAEVAFGEVADVDRAVRSAADAFTDRRWAGLAPAERARRMRRVAELLQDNAERLAELEARDSGAPLAKTRGDVAGAAELFYYFAQLPEHVSGRTYASPDGYLLYSQRTPYGVVGAIAPWNFPLLLACWKTAPALAVGNSVVLKMAEQTPLTTTQFGKICAEAGIPPGVVNVVQGDGALTGAALVRHPLVGKITFTGSTESPADPPRGGAGHQERAPGTGRQDAEHRLRRCRPRAGRRGSLFTTYFNSGQVCTSGSRVLVQQDIAEEFTSAFAEHASHLVVGDPLDAHTQLGPLVSRVQQERVNRYIEVGRSEGATAVVGGESTTHPGDGGFFVSPTVFTSVQQDMRIAREEIFGPEPRSSRSPTKTTRSRRRTTSSTAWRPRSGPATWAGPCGWQIACKRGSCGPTARTTASGTCRTRDTSSVASARTRAWSASPPSPN